MEHLPKTKTKKKRYQSQHFGLGRIFATIVRAVWIVRFCWNSLKSKRCSVQHEGNKWKEGEEPAEEVGSYPGAGTCMGRGRVQGGRGWGVVVVVVRKVGGGDGGMGT